LRMGAAGKSYALEVAERLGLDHEVVKRARAIIGPGNSKVGDLLSRLGEEIDRSETARQKAEETANRMESARIRQELRQEKYRGQFREIREKARKDARGMLREIERKGREIIRDLPRQDRENARKSFQKSLETIRKDIAERMPPTRHRKESVAVHSGDDVRIIPLGVRGTVEKLAPVRQEAEIISGGIRMKVPLKDLEPAEMEGASAVPPVKPAPVSYTGIGDERSEISFLGKTVPEALESMDRLIDRSLMGSLPTLRIVHGGGTGALKKAVREALKRDPRVSSFGPAPLNEGGDGVTIVVLKE
jgi:DNA mismatch repair protein MutS2